jgi:protocatechuate 3,4-dioxygenase alpha subunit
MSFQATASQTVGPYFRIGVEPLYQSDVAGIGALGERIEISGAIHDGDGVPVIDAFIEIWQADAEGIYRHPEDARSTGATSPFKGFGRIAADDNGVFRFSTVKPGRTPGPQGQAQAAHLVVLVYMRGILKPLLTRLYFAGDAALAEDPVLALVPEARRATLIAQPDGANAWRWDVHMQGDRETVAFSC